MKVALLNTYDISGGAAIAAYRLHLGLMNIGVDSWMLVDIKYGNNANVLGPSSRLGKAMGYIRPVLEALPLQLYRKKQNSIFSSGFIPNGNTVRILSFNPDIVHFHWICQGFIRIESLRKIKKPIVWTLHDMWAFTGGCHYAGECQKYRTECGACPQLGSTRESDLSGMIFRKKQKTYSELNIHIVTPSKWLGACSKRSRLLSKFPVHVIPNGIDTAVFKPIHKEVARQICNLPDSKKIILFGAMSAVSDKRKGFNFLIKALKHLKNNLDKPDDCLVIIFGADGSNSNEALPFEIKYAGVYSDELSISLLYNCADVFVLPSLEDNLPNTVVESLSCGTPVAAFNVGGIPDMIDHEHTGYLAKPFDPGDLARGIEWIISDEKRWNVLSRQARQKVEQEFEIRSVAQRYIDLYNDII